MNATNGRFRNERGSTLVIAMVGVTVGLSILALTLDLGMLFTARHEAQRAADAGALAGVSAYTDSLTPMIYLDAEGIARERAAEYATRNAIRDAQIALDEVTVQVIADSQEVRVQTRRADISTWFARMFGVQSMPVAAEAVARAPIVNELRCVRPLAPTDPSTRGLTDAQAFGERIYLKIYREPENEIPGDPFPIVISGKDGREGSCPYNTAGSDNGATAFRANICMCNRSRLAAGAQYPVIKGIKRGPTEQAAQWLIDQDPGAVWDAGSGRIVGSRYPNWRQSPRVFPVPLYDPAVADGKTITVTRFAWVFLEETRGSGVVGRYLVPVRMPKLVK